MDEKEKVSLDAEFSQAWSACNAALKKFFEVASAIQNMSIYQSRIIDEKCGEVLKLRDELGKLGKK